MFGLSSGNDAKRAAIVVAERGARAEFHEHVTNAFAYKNYPFQRQRRDVTLRLPDASRTAAGPSIGADEPPRRGTGMDTDRLDCTWCGSAASIEHGICQVCLMEYPVDMKVIRLPLDRGVRPKPRSIQLADSEVVAEK
jgi:hypothetical protein